MSHNIVFIPKGLPDVEGNYIPLRKLDEEVCSFLGIPVDPMKYCLSWFDLIAKNLAFGDSMEAVKENLEKYKERLNGEVRQKYGDEVANVLLKEQDDLIKICGWLQEKYDIKVWASWH